jgi:hypothetical protein
MTAQQFDDLLTKEFGPTAILADGSFLRVTVMDRETQLVANATVGLRWLAENGPADVIDYFTSRFKEKVGEEWR